MRRKLIKQDAFDRIVNESVTTAERELVEAEPILAKALGKDFLSLHSFTESTVLYETLDKSYVHAGYEIKNGQITFNNIEELVIDESSRRAKMRSILSDMVDQILSDNTSKANELFKDYLSMVRWDEIKGKFPFKKSKSKDKEDKGEFPFKKGKKHKSDEKKNYFFGKVKKAGKELAEAYVVANNVLEYCDFMRVGPALAEAVTKADEKGNVTDLRLPTTRVRNESRLHRIDWRVLNAKIADSRKAVAGLVENQNFCSAVANLKRQNAFSDAQGLDEALDAIVKNWPEVLYVTQSELAQVISEALQTTGAKNYDDQTCEFMAEGILRKAHDAYAERVAQVLHLASAPKMQEGADPYLFFQYVAENFYPLLDEKFGLERQVFVDLYDSLTNIYKKAERQGDNALKSEATSYLNELAAVLNGEARPDLELAEEIAEWTANIIETNLEMGKWVVSNTPHLTVTGDHPDMAKKAAHSYTPSKDFSGDWGDAAPAIGQDSNNYKSGKHAKTMRNDSWGQTGDKEDTFPKLRNPYVPKPFGDYTMKGEKGVDKDNAGWSLFKTDDTWPDLKNPYVPKEAGGIGGKGHKMKNGKETDLVVDK
jgi:hypothetical protein